MKSYDSQLERQVEEKFREYLVQYEVDLRIRSNEPWYIKDQVRRFDFVIYQNRNPLAVVEVKSRLNEGSNRFNGAMAQVLDGLNITNARFGIVTDYQQFYIKDKKEKEGDFKLVSFDELFEILIAPERAELSEVERFEIVNFFRIAVHNHLSENKELLNLVNQKSFHNQLYLDNDSHTIRFKNSGGAKSFENRFFSILFPKFSEKQICRYTSLDTLFSMLSHNSIRMSGLVGMNDRSEVNYVDGILERAEKPFRDQHHHSITAINNRYISSCTQVSNRDNLTMWRLYGDDSKGVCLTFDTRLANLNENIILHPVKYANAEGKHPELEMIKEVKSEVQNLTGYPFEFRKLRYWKHFFKSHEYKVEEEIRLLVVDNESLEKEGSNWVMTHTHSIFNPTIDFLLNSKNFPIHLKEIMLGPKCPEQEINKVQIEEMLRRKRRELEGKDVNLNGLSVVVSQINNYR